MLQQGSTSVPAPVPTPVQTPVPTLASSSSSSSSLSFPYRLSLGIRFPEARLAEAAKRSLSVDEEISDRVRRVFRIDDDVLAAGSGGNVANSGGDEGGGVTGAGAGAGLVMRVDFEATEARLLRASVTGFWDMLKVVLKTMQEFR